MTALSSESCHAWVISLASDTRQATQLFDCTSPRALRFSGIEEWGSETPKGHPPGWSRCPSRVPWLTAQRLALARSSSWLGISFIGNAFNWWAVTVHPADCLDSVDKCTCYIPAPEGPDLCSLCHILCAEQSLKTSPILELGEHFSSFIS